MEFLEISKQLNLEELNEVQDELDELDVSFTLDFKLHCLKYNGGYPAKRYYRWPNGAKTRINHFFSIQSENFTSLEEVYADLFVIEPILPTSFLPYAADDGGDFFCISTLPDTYNAVFFCDMHHYDPQVVENYFTLLTISFNDFIENLVD